MIMEENTQLPKEVENKIIDESYDKYNLPSEAVQREAYREGATAYASKLHLLQQKHSLLEDEVRVLTYDNNRLKGEVEGLKNWKMNAAEELTIVGAYAHKHLEVNPSDSIAQLVMAHLNEGRTLLNEVFSKHEAGLDRLIYEKIKTFLYGE